MEPTPLKIDPKATDEVALTVRLTPGEMTPEAEEARARAIATPVVTTELQRIWRELQDEVDRLRSKLPDDPSTSDRTQRQYDVDNAFAEGVSRAALMVARRLDALADLDSDD